MSDDSVLLLEGKTERLLDDSERAPPADDYVVLPPLVYKIVFATLMITCFMAVRAAQRKSRGAAAQGRVAAAHRRRRRCGAAPPPRCF